jgi:hypothetical protein
MPLQPNPYIPTDAVPDIDEALGFMRNAVCTIQRPGTARDAGGAPVSGVYGTVAVRDCRVIRGGTASNEYVLGGRFTGQADYEVRLPRDADVRNNDRILVDDVTLEVVAPPDVATHGLELIVPVSVTS